MSVLQLLQFHTYCFPCPLLYITSSFTFIVFITAGLFTKIASELILLQTNSGIPLPRRSTPLKNTPFGSLCAQQGGGGAPCWIFHFCWKTTPPLLLLENVTLSPDPVAFERLPPVCVYTFQWQLLWMHNGRVERELNTKHTYTLQAVKC